MKTPSILTLLLLAAPTVTAVAEDNKSLGDKTKEVLAKVEEKTKEAGQAVVDGTKRATKALVDAVTPDSDAAKVEVKIDDRGIDMPAKLPAGKTAFVVKNAGTDKHNFHIKGQDVDEKFLMDVGVDDTKVMHVDLKPGTYEITCPAKAKEGDAMNRTLKVE